MVLVSCIAARCSGALTLAVVLVFAPLQLDLAGIRNLAALRSVSTSSEVRVALFAMSVCESAAVLVSGCVST